MYFMRISLLLLLFSMSNMAAWAQSPVDQSGSLTLDLKEALARARQNSPQLQAAALAVDLAHEERYVAKTALLPSLNYQNQYIYTQGNGTPSGIFVSNDGVHVYNSQAVVHQDLYVPGRLSEYHRAFAAEALAAAKRDIALRGLVNTVYQDYYALVIAQRHRENTQKSVAEARHFFEITEKLEQGGEVAHADVIKAQLTLKQRERDLEEAQLAIGKAKVMLAVLLFPNFRTDFTVVDDLAQVSILPQLEQILGSAIQNNPDLQAAQQVLRQEEYGVSIARSAYLPTFTFDYFFGINNNRFATRDEEGHNRLGSAAQASLNIPVFNWLSTRSKVRQADLRRRQAELDLTLTQRELNANVRTLYLEAQAALDQLNSLKQSLDLSTDSLRLTSLRYQAGEATAFEVVDAQATLLQARNAYDDGLWRSRQAAANLQILTGIY